MTVLHDAYFRRSSEGYSLACPGESARPRVLVSFRADLAFAVRCLVSCAPPQKWCLLPIRERCRPFREHACFRPSRRKERCTWGRLRDMGMGAPQLRAARAPRVTCDMTLPCVASPRFASRHGTSRSGMSGMSRPATVPNAAPVFGRSRSSGFSSGRLHSRWLWTSQICCCFHSRGRAFAVSVWCAVRLEAGYRTELPACPTLPFPFCGRCVGR